MQVNNIEQFVNGFKLEPLEIKKLNENYIINDLTATPIDKKFIFLKNLNKVVMGVAALITLSFCLIYNWGYIIVGGLFVLIFNSVSPFLKELKQELANRKRIFDNLMSSFKTLIKHHNNPADFNKYNQSANNLAGLIHSFRKLPEEFITNKKKIEEKHYNAKYNLYLQKFEILYNSIPSFGSSKKRLIYDNGIKTAADIGKLNNIKITGIGPKNIQILNDWQRHVGAGFTYSPDFNKINFDINIAANEIAAKKQKLEVDIKAEYKNLLILKTNIISTTNILKNQYNDLSRKLYQAELDLNEFQERIK